MAKIYLLGTGTPTPTPTRFGSSHVIEVGGQHIMFDCGPATTYKLVQAGLWPTQIDYLFFSHHHFDHDVDYPCFLLCRWDQSSGKENELKVFGPTLTETITDRILNEEARRVRPRLAGPGQFTRQPAGFRESGRHAAPQAAVCRRPGHWPRTGAFGQRLERDRVRRRTCPALVGLSRLPVGYAGRQRGVHGRHPPLPVGGGLWPKTPT